MAQRVMSVRGALYPGSDDLLFSVSSAGSSAIAEVFNTVGGQATTPLLRLRSMQLSQSGDLMQMQSPTGILLSGMTSAGAYYHCTNATVGNVYRVASVVGTAGVGAWVGGCALTTSCQGGTSNPSSNTNILIIPVGTPAGSQSKALLETVQLAVSWVGQLSILQGGTGCTTAATAFTALAPTSTVGALITHNGSTFVSLPGYSAVANTKRFLTQTSSGTVGTSAIPTWGEITVADVTGGVVTTAGNQTITGTKTFAATGAQTPSLTIYGEAQQEEGTFYSLNIHPVTSGSCALKDGEMVTTTNVGVQVFTSGHITNQSGNIASTTLVDTASAANTGFWDIYYILEVATENTVSTRSVSCALQAPIGTIILTPFFSLDAPVGTRATGNALVYCGSAQTIAYSTAVTSGAGADGLYTIHISCRHIA